MEKSFIFDSVLVDGVYDRQYLSSDFCGYFSSFIGNGIFPSPSTNLQVMQNENLDVAVLAGKAFINGRTYHNTDKLVFTLDVADGVLNRIDTVVVRVNHLAREIKAVIKKGTFAVNPVPPSLINNADYEEIQLAKIYIKAGAIKLTQADITDTRLDSKVCGVVHGTVDQVDTSTLFKQYQSWYEQETGKAVEDMEGFKAQFQSDLIAWFEGLKSILDDNAATNLLNLINEVKENTYTKTETDTLISEQVGINATATHSGTVVAITAPPDAVQIIFIAPSNFSESDTYTLNGTAITITDLNLEPLSDAWKQGATVPLTIKGNRGFFKAGGGVYGTLSPQVRNFVAKAGNHEIKLNWTNPNDSNHAGTFLVRKQGSKPQKLSDGTKIDVGKAKSYTDKEPENDKLYYYRAFTYNAKKQVQTELTGAVVSAIPKAFSLPKFTGQHAIFGNEEKGRIEMYTSGTLTLSEANYDLFAVSGGGGSSGSRDDTTYVSGGGSGGIAKTVYKVYISDKKNINVSIAAQGHGNITTISDYIDTTAPAGTVVTGQSSNVGAVGGSGGSGGGCRKGTYELIFGDGGSNGSDGQYMKYEPQWEKYMGLGQHTTTRAFGTGTLYSGGGGCGGGGKGGAGGGADGVSGVGRNGTANTGGGAGGVRGTYPGALGGSGIAIIRWGY